MALLALGGAGDTLLAGLLALGGAEGGEAGDELLGRLALGGAGGGRGADDKLWGYSPWAGRAEDCQHAEEACPVHRGGGE